MQAFLISVLLVWVLGMNPLSWITGILWGVTMFTVSQLRGKYGKH